MFKKNGKVYWNTLERWSGRIFFENKENLIDNTDYNIKNHLSVQKFSRPERSEISENVKPYIQVIKNKFRNLKSDVIQRYKRRNNLNKNQLS